MIDLHSFNQSLKMKWIKGYLDILIMENGNRFLTIILKSMVAN